MKVLSRMIVATTCTRHAKVIPASSVLIVKLHITFTYTHSLFLTACIIDVNDGLDQIRSDKAEPSSKVYNHIIYQATL